MRFERFCFPIYSGQQGWHFSQRPAIRDESGRISEFIPERLERVFFTVEKKVED